MNLMRETHPQYVVGLVDGDGSFTVYVRNPKEAKKVKRRVTVEPKFYLRLIKENKEILYRLKDFFDCGEVYFQKDRRKNHKDCYRYEVFNREELNKIIIPFFKKHSPQVPTRKKDFDLFCKIMDLVNEDRHLEEDGQMEIYRIKQKMH